MSAPTTSIDFITVLPPPLPSPTGRGESPPPQSPRLRGEVIAPLPVHGEGPGVGSTDKRGSE